MILSSKPIQWSCINLPTANCLLPTLIFRNPTIFILAGIFLLCNYSILLSQPPRSYKKQMKQKEKGIKTDEQQSQSNEKGLNEIKRLKQKQNDFLKAQQDADASGDGDLSLKLQKKINDIGGQINFKEDKMEAKIVKEHRKIQSKETRKRMKQNSKKSNRLNDNRREPFYERWYKKWKGKK